MTAFKVDPRTTTPEDSRSATLALPPVPSFEPLADQGFMALERTYLLAPLESICVAKGGVKCATENVPLDKYVVRFEIWALDNKFPALESGPWVFDYRETSGEVVKQWVEQCRWVIATQHLNVPEKDRVPR